MANEEPITIKVYGQEFTLRVPPQDKELLRKAAHFVEQRMKEIADSGIISLHRVAMLAAIDIAFQAFAYLPEEKGDQATLDPAFLDSVKQRINSLIQRIDRTLEEESTKNKGGTNRDRKK